jgi:endonuclease/exonuclease/phosphatase family metal-dependent hydrolase
MDFNYYYHRQQVSQMQADVAASNEARRAHQQMADAYARLIEYEQKQRGADIATSRH